MQQIGGGAVVFFVQNVQTHFEAHHALYAQAFEIFFVDSKILYKEEK